MVKKLSVQAMEGLLLEWAAWLTVGDGSGYAAMSVLHEDWAPPTPGQSPTMKVSNPTHAQALHQAIGQLSLRQRNTLVVHYCLGLPISEQAARLQCGVSTVYARIVSAKRDLVVLLAPG